MRTLLHRLRTYTVRSATALTLLDVRRLRTASRVFTAAAIAGGLNFATARAEDAAPTSKAATPTAEQATVSSKEATKAAALAEAAKAAGMDALPANANSKITLMIVSDSTAAEYDATMVVRGWGQYLPDLLPKERVTVLNRAAPGRSAKSYMEEGSWKAALHEKPEYVIIQFGHNDAVLVQSIGEKAAVREFKKYIGGYVDTALKAGIKPILMTPTATRTFDKNGVEAVDELGAFVEAVRSVAGQRNVALIDIHSQCQELYKLLKKDQANQLNSTPQDPVHFNELGAKAVADIIARDLPTIDPRFSKKMLTKYEIKLQQLPKPK
jgi:lysophospholipase L1-like esterase